jgi:hypothetical protein
MLSDGADVPQEVVHLDETVEEGLLGASADLEER